jgi:hypothetical protein
VDLFPLTVGLLLIAVLVVLAITFTRREVRDANGRVQATTALDPTEVLDTLSRHLVKQSWSIQHRDAEFVALTSGPNVGTGCILSILFLPLGLVYLLTDMGKGRLNVRASPVSALETRVAIEWQGAGVRKQIEAFAQWLERDGQE